MSVERITYFSYTSVLLTLVFGVHFTNSLQFSGDDANKVKEAIQKYFPVESNLCVVLSESDKEAYLLPLQVPVVVFTQDLLLQDCGRKLTDQGGYVFMTSNTDNLEKQIVPLLKCLNRTKFKLKSKYILVLDFSEDCRSINNYKDYSTFFHDLWKHFGIINIGIFPVQNQNSNKHVIFTYNPFIAPYSNSSSALKTSSTTQNIRGVMVDRFRNVHGYHLKTVFFRFPRTLLFIEDFSKEQTPGAAPTILLKQILEKSINASFDLYESSVDLLSSKSDSAMMISEEISSGRSDFCINLRLLPQALTGLKKLQFIKTGVFFDLVFIVPTPKQVESWRLFQYIFQWKVSVGLGIVMVLLCGAAFMFVCILHSNPSPSNHSTDRTSEIVTLWRAFLSLPITRLPTTHSQRILIALSLLLGLIFLTLFSTQLFALVKSRPKIAPIKTLQDLSDSNLPIYSIYESFSQYLNSFENTTLYRLKKNLKTDKMYENAIYWDPSFLNITDRAVVYTHNILNLVASLPHNKAYLQYFEVVKEPIFETSVVMYFPIGSVFTDHFNDINLRLISGGFYTKWSDARKDKLVEHYASTSTPSALDVGVGSHRTDDDRVPLTYDDLSMAFYILYIGLTAATVCFIIEMCTF